MDTQTLSQLQIFQQLTPEELDTVKSHMESCEYAQATEIFQRDDPGGTMFIVVDGLIEINARIGLELDKALANVPAGAVFGELSLFTLEPRSASAVALEDTTLLAINTPSFEQLLRDYPAAGSKILRYLTQIISDRLRNTTDMYRQALEWSLSVSGAMELHFDNLITDEVNIVLNTVDGRVLQGQLLKIDQNIAGQVFIIGTPDGQFKMIPYHAVSSVSFENTQLSGGNPNQQELF